MGSRDGFEQSQFGRFKTFVRVHRQVRPHGGRRVVDQQQPGEVQRHHQLGRTNKTSQCFAGCKIFFILRMFQ
jgi:hypothetical protein